MQNETTIEQLFKALERGCDENAKHVLTILKERVNAISVRAHVAGVQRFVAVRGLGQISFVSVPEDGEIDSGTVKSLIHSNKRNKEIVIEALKDAGCTLKEVPTGLVLDMQEEEQNRRAAELAASEQAVS